MAHITSQASGNRGKVPVAAGEIRTTPAERKVELLASLHGEDQLVRDPQTSAVALTLDTELPRRLGET